MSGSSGGRIHFGLNYQGASFQILEIKSELLKGIVRVQRCTRGSGNHAEEGRGHLGAVGEHDGNPGVVPDSAVSERLKCGADLIDEAAIGKRQPPGSPNRDRLRIPLRLRPDQLIDAQNHDVIPSLQRVPAHE